MTSPHSYLLHISTVLWPAADLFLSTAIWDLLWLALSHHPLLAVRLNGYLPVIPTTWPAGIYWKSHVSSTQCFLSAGTHDSKTLGYLRVLLHPITPLWPILTKLWTNDDKLQSLAFKLRSLAVRLWSLAVRLQTHCNMLMHSLQGSVMSCNSHMTLLTNLS